MKTLLSILLFSGVLLAQLCFVQPSVAQVYKWVDENGKVHFSDKPPVDAKTETVNLNHSNVSDERQREIKQQRLQQQQQLLKTMEAERKSLEKQRAEQRQAKKDHEILCAKLKKKKEKAIWATHFYTTDKNGERVYDDEKTAEAIRQKAIDNYDQTCLKK